MKRSAVYAALAAVVSCLITAVLVTTICIRHTNEAVHRSQTVWCAVVVTLDNAYHLPSDKPRPPIVQQLAQNISALRKSLGC